MFSEITYVERRYELKKKFKKGILLFLGNEESPMNYKDNTYHYRQDSTFLYYWGLNQPGVAALINIDKDEEIIFGDERGLDDIVVNNEFCFLLRNVSSNNGPILQKVLHY